MYFVFILRFGIDRLILVRVARFGDGIVYKIGTYRLYRGSLASFPMGLSVDL
jgi:hypothetical protein